MSNATEIGTSITWNADEKIDWYLNAALQTGLLGNTRAEVLASLVRRGIQELVRDGLIASHFPVVLPK